MRKGKVKLYYRVENSKGKGPYSLPGPMWICGRHTEKTGRPNPWVEYDQTHSDRKFLGRLYPVTMPPKWRFAFKTLRQLQAWFRPIELCRLEKLGYRTVRVIAHAVFADLPTQSIIIIKGRKHVSTDATMAPSTTF